LHLPCRRGRSKDDERGQAFVFETKDGPTQLAPYAGTALGDHGVRAAAANDTELSARQAAKQKPLCLVLTCIPRTPFFSMERSVKRKEKAHPAESSRNKSIVFFHPDLGIGGAERLVVDAAVGLQNLGHKVTIFTSYRDTNHCFDEARDGTLDIRVRGGWLFPATVLGRFKILCTILRQIHLILAITWSGELAKLKPTAFFVDQLSAGIPFLRWFWEDQKILFYCHFPDLLLVQGRKKWYMRIWRIGFDWWEGWGIRGADRIVANSGYTKGVVEDVWNGLGGDKGVGVVYPSVNTKRKEKSTNEKGDSQELWKGKKILLSINRFERKKDVGLAIKAFAGLKPKDREGVRLVIAGT